ncbi:MAG TPA: hypothetical protein VEV62_08315 [Parafilimonas sp.]|nr:hypothetical protein [Parafilimonas sp.]
MQDTPEHIKQLQLELWLSKTMSERLEQFLLDNDALFKLWKQAQQQVSANNNNNIEAGVFNYVLPSKQS